MDVNAIQQLMNRRENGSISDVEYLQQSKNLIDCMITANEDEEAEKSALLACIESLQVRAQYWEQRERDELGQEVESWLTVAVS